MKIDEQVKNICEKEPANKAGAPQILVIAPKDEIKVQLKVSFFK